MPFSKASKSSALAVVVVKPTSMVDAVATLEKLLRKFLLLLLLLLLMVLLSDDIDMDVEEDGVHGWEEDNATLLLIVDESAGDVNASVSLPERRIDAVRRRMRGLILFFRREKAMIVLCGSVIQL